MKWLGIAGGVLILLLLVVGAFWWTSKSFDIEKSINRDGYQAVFLSNNQVYFGHLEHVGPDRFVLKDVFYLQVNQTVQAQKDEATPQVPEQASLSKLGSEVHGPEDAMYINRDHVLFWENLRNDSKVVQAIKETKNK